jgi:hypothetical protein
MPPAPNVPFDPSHYISDRRITLIEFRDGALTQSVKTVKTDAPIQSLPFFSPNVHVYKSGIVLNDPYRLADLGVNPGAIIDVIALPIPKPAHRIVFFRTRAIPHSFCPPKVTDKSFCITVPANCSVLTLKKYCAARFSVDPRWIMLTFLDQLMQERFTLDHYRYVTSGIIDCAIGSMDGDHLRVNFDHYGGLTGSITCRAKMPGLALMKHLLDTHVPVNQPVFVARPRNRLIAPMAMIEGFARHNSLLVGLYSCEDQILIVDVKEGPSRPPHVVEFDDQTTVYDVKRKLREYAEVPIARQLLRSRHIETELPNDLAFSQFPVRPHVLSLQVRPETGHILRLRADRAVIVVPIQGPEDLMSDVKWAVARKIGESPNDFALVVPPARILELRAPLWQVGIGSKARLFVVREEEETVPVVIANKAFSTELELPLLATVAVVKELLLALHVWPFPDMRLFVDQELITDDEALVKDLGIAPRSRIVVT